MFHSVHDVPVRGIASFVDVEEASVDRVGDKIAVKGPVSEPHVPASRRCACRPIVAGQLAGGRRPYASTWTSRIDGARNVDCLESVGRQDIAMNPSVGACVDAANVTLWRDPRGLGRSGARNVDREGKSASRFRKKPWMVSFGFPSTTVLVVYRPTIWPDGSMPLGNGIGRAWHVEAG